MLAAIRKRRLKEMNMHKVIREASLIIVFSSFMPINWITTSNKFTIQKPKHLNLITLMDDTRNKFLMVSCFIPHFIIDCSEKLQLLVLVAQQAASSPLHLLNNRAKAFDVAAIFENSHQHT